MATLFPQERNGQEMSLSIEEQLKSLNESELRRLLVEHLTRKKLGLSWEHNAIERDKALNSDVVLPRLVTEMSVRGSGPAYNNIVIEGDNFDSLRLLRATHANKVRVIFIDPPYNTGGDWIYNDRFVGERDRWRHSRWLEFLYQRLVLARDLLTPDGVIMVCINDENRARLDLLMEEIFPGRRIGSFVWRTRQGAGSAGGGFLSTDHEHVLIYANEGFEFAGTGRDETKYDNPDNDPRGAWGNQMLNKAHIARDRPEAYYHIRDPETDIWYPCDPDSVWRFASITRPQKKRLQADPIETIIQEKRVLWPSGPDARVVSYDNLDDLRRAIKNGSAPKGLRIYNELDKLHELAASNPKVQRLLSYIDPLEVWVGRKIGYGKPRYKRFRSQLRHDAAPLSSWLLPAADKELAPNFEDEDDDEDVQTVAVGATGEGTALYRQIFGNKDFPYPKPLSLVAGLLSQATLPGDIVLDFFAGSATTAHAVLALNAADAGGRRFIMCSSTEASVKHADRNVCRDICAERIRRVIAGFGDTAGLAGDFGYVVLDKFRPGDVTLDARPEHAHALLAMRRIQGLLQFDESEQLHILGVTDDDTALVLVPELRADVVAQLKALPYSRLAVYCDRPSTLSEHMQDSGKQGTCYSIDAELLLGQLAAPQD